MTGARSPPPLSPLRPDNPHRTLHTELLIHPFSSRAQVNFMLAGVERLRRVQQGAAARHAHELCGGHRLRSGEAVAAGGIARVRSPPRPCRGERTHFFRKAQNMRRKRRAGTTLWEEGDEIASADRKLAFGNRLPPPQAARRASSSRSVRRASD